MRLGAEGSRWLAWRVSEGLGLGGEEAVGRGGEEGVFDGGAVATHEDGVHDSEGAADAEGEAEEEADQCGPVASHSSYDVMVGEVSSCGDGERAGGGVWTG